MKQSTSFNPGIYAKITDRAFEICKTTNAQGKKDVQKCFDAAIKEFGYTPAYVAKMMRMFGENPGM